MKVRQGFVSNSSSSSFMIATKGELTQEKLIEAFNVPENSFLYGFAKDVSKCLVSNIDATVKSVVQLTKHYDWLEVDEIEKWHQPEIDLLNCGMTLHIGSVADDCSDVERWLCYADIEFDSDDLIIQKDGGY